MPDIHSFQSHSLVICKSVNMRSSVHSLCKLAILASVIRLNELAILRGKRQINEGGRDSESTTVSAFLYMTPAAGKDCNL